MPIVLKSKRQIALLHAAGQLVADTFRMLGDYVRPGVTTAELDTLAEEFIRSHGAEPVYKGYGAMPRRGPHPARKAFPATICASVNDVICHGIPNARQTLHEGDIIGVDIGVRLNGWVGDACVTYPVGTVSPQTQHLLHVTRGSLERGLEQAQLGNTLGDIGAAIQRYAEGEGFAVVREYTGHGVGRNLHEEPTVLHFGEPGKGQRLLKGMVFTIEPMVNVGSAETRLERDAWTVRTVDRSWSAQFEHTVAMTEDGPLVLTR